MIAEYAKAAKGLIRKGYSKRATLDVRVLIHVVCMAVMPVMPVIPIPEANPRRDAPTQLTEQPVLLCPAKYLKVTGIVSNQAYLNHGETDSNACKC